MSSRTLTKPLPAGWAVVRLADVAELNPRDFALEPVDTDIVSFVPMGSVEAGTGRMSASDVQRWGDVKKGYTRFQDGDVLFAKITPCMENGKVAIAAQLHGGRAAGSTEFHVLRTSEALNPKYLLYFVLQGKVRREARAIMKGGAGQLRVPVEFLRDLNLPLPPLTEQSRIVATVEAQLSRLDVAVAGLRRVRCNLNRYRAAILESAVLNCLTERSDQPLASRSGWEPIRSVIASFDQGWSPKCESHPASDPEQWGVIKTTAVQPLAFHASENKELPSDLVARRQLEIRRGDVLVTRAGPRRRVGVACVVESTREKLMLCDKVYRIRVTPDVMRPRFLAILLNAPSVVEELNDLKTGISDSGVNLTHHRFLGLKIPVPPPSVQEHIEEQVGRALSLVASVESTVILEEMRINRLRQSILKRAFEGKLVPQDSNDEPASALLERIRASRAEQKPSKPKRGRRTATAAAD